MRFYNDPQTAAGPDVALIDLDDVDRRPETFAAVLPQQVESRASVTLRGGKSGTARGGVLEAMLRTIDGDGRRWINSWWVNWSRDRSAEWRPAVAPRSKTQQILGIWLWSAGTIGRKGQRQSGIVQELETVLGYIERESRIHPPRPTPAPTMLQPAREVAGDVGYVRVPDLTGSTVAEAREKVSAIDEIMIGAVAVRSARTRRC